MKYSFTICVVRVWILLRYFLFDKHAFNGLLKVIGLKKYFGISVCGCSVKLLINTTIPFQFNKKEYFLHCCANTIQTP